MRWHASIALTLAGTALGGAVQANCGDLIAALEKADRQSRVAQYDLDRRDQPLTDKPVLVRIGKVVFDGFGGDYERHETDGTNPVLASLKRAEKAGTARCALAGSDTWRGEAVTKVAFDNPMAPKSANPTTFWISRSSGLPVYHEVNGLGPGGYAWVFGDAVKEPVIKKR